MLGLHGYGRVDRPLDSKLRHQGVFQLKITTWSVKLQPLRTTGTALATK